MKRKLFTLLAAFMALATFQSYARGGVAPYDGQTLHYLNVWTAGQERLGHKSGDCFVDTYPSRIGVIHEAAKDYPLSADLAQSPAGTYTGKALHAMKYVFNVNFDKWELTNSNRLGTVGDVSTYFTLEANSDDLYNTYTIRTASPNNITDNGNRIFFKKSNGEEVNQFVFLRFETDNGDEYDGLNATPNAATVKDSVGMVPWTSKYVTPQTGGYLAANIMTGRAQGGENDRSLYVVAYDTTLNVNGAPNNRYAIYSMDEVRKNWADIANGVKGKVRIVPVWVQAKAIGGRWATINDFPDEFIKFPIQPTTGNNVNYFTVKDGANDVSVFKVDTVGALNFGQFGSLKNGVKTVVHNPAAANDMINGDNPASTLANGDTTRLYKKTTGDWELQYFTIANPCTGNLLMVDRDPALPVGLYNGDGKFGNKLAIKPEFTATSTSYPGATLDELKRVQRFAIWINENGNMELYPLNSWTRAYSDNKYKTSVPTSPGYNYAVWMDKPGSLTSTQVDNDNNFNNAFKVCLYNGIYCTGMVSGGASLYTNLELRPEKAILINKIVEGRYYFIQMKGTPKANFYAYTASGANTKLNDSIYVLDLVRTATGEKRVVMTPAESDRFNYNLGSTRYFETPYDSVNMSAHWRFVKVPGGYNLINELNDTLEYAYDATGNPTFVVAGTQSAYIKDQESVYVDAEGTKGYKSDVWQTVHLDCYGEYFKLRNMAESTTERPVLNMPYLDTVKTVYSGLIDGSSYYWYAGSRGRTSTTNHLQKDVRLVNSGPTAGMLFKIADVAYEYQPGGLDNERTNHSSDGYYPSDDSLCVYLYKEGNYNITEATSLKLSVKDGFTGPDATYGLNLAGFINSDNANPWLYTEPVISRNNPDLAAYKYLVPMTYLDANSVPQLNVDYMLTQPQMLAVKKATSNPTLNEMLKTEGFNVDSYKWHYVKNAKGQYLVYDTINTTTTLAAQQFGFKFLSTDRSNATMFRFYQPLVGDKSKENFIMEFRVAKHDYTDYRTASTPYAEVKWDNLYSTDNYGINPFFTTAGSASTLFSPGNPETPNMAAYQTLLTDVLAAGTNMADQTKWTPALIERYLRYLNYERQVRTKYALLATASDPMYATWNDGRNKETNAPQAATRFKFTGPDMTPCAKDYVDTKYLMETQLYANPTVKANMVDVHVSENTLTKDFIGTKANKYADNNPTAVNLLITLADTLKVGSTPGVNGYLKSLKGTTAALDRYNHYENTREVEFYYIQNAADTTLYLTIDTTSLYAETMESTLDGVSGMKLKWATKFTSNSQKGTNLETADYRPLQMFAIYGCKNPTTPFGNFILIPAASWEYNYTAKKHTAIVANNKVGNTSVVDEFRISEGHTGGSSSINYMIVMPSSQNAPQGVTPTEYKFTRTPYFDGDYFCDSANDDKHSFIQTQGFLPKAQVKGTFVHSYKVTSATAVKDYNDPSMHWSICKNVDGTYNFTPESDMWDGNGDKVPARNQLMKQYYLIPMDVNDSYYAFAKYPANEFGEKPQVFMAVPKDAPARENIITVTITRMTETEGDACTTAFLRFSTEDLYNDWSILESIITDRYLYTRGKTDGSGYTDINGTPSIAENGKAPAYYEQADGTPRVVQFLKIRESNTTYQNEKNGDTVYHHSVPYYNIIHVLKNTETGEETEFYLEMGYNSENHTGDLKDVVVQFRHLTAREKYVVENYNQYPDSMQAVKFCFPYKLNAKNEDSTLVTLNNGVQNRFKNVAIRTMPIQNETFYLGVGSPNTQQTKAVKDSTQADVFVIAPNSVSDEEWLGNASKSGWLKDFSRSTATSIYLVEPSGADPVNYGLLSYHADVLPNINDGEFTFNMVLDTIVNKYTKTHIWYYQIKNKAGKLLTYKPLAGLPSNDTQYKYGEYTYAYFADAAANANKVTKDNNQVFGLLLNKAKAQGTTGHDFKFWVVAQVPTGDYKYLGQYNNRMVFIPTGTDSKSVARAKAMTFEIGQMNNGNFTGKDDIDGGAVAVYGVEGAVKVVNATGTIEIYTIDGRQFKSVLATGSEQTISAPRGVMIVKVAGKATKVIVK